MQEVTTPDWEPEDNTIGQRCLQRDPTEQVICVRRQGHKRDHLGSTSDEGKPATRRYWSWPLS